MKNRQNIYIIKQDIQMYVRKAGQTDGPIGLIFFRTLMGGRGGGVLKAKN